MKLLNYCWRLFATGVCFTLFGIGGLILTIAYFPWISIVFPNRDQRKDHAQWVIHKSFALFVWFMTSTGVLRLEVRGRHNLRSHQNYLVVANHPTLIDVVILIAIIGRCDCVVKESLWKNIFLRGVVQAAGYIRNSDAAASLDGCIDSLKRGRILILFPEGTRTTPGQPLKFQRGAANIALRSQRNLIPITIHCRHDTLNKNSSWYDVPKEGKVIMDMEIHPQMSVAPFMEESQPPSKSARQLTQFMQRFFEEEVVAK